MHLKNEIKETLNCICKMTHFPFELNCIVAATPQGGIGIQGKLPWRIPEDMAYFQRITTCFGREETSPLNVVIMGRKTWESIPLKFRPLKNRVNIILSKSFTLPETQTLVSTRDTRNDVHERNENQKERIANASMNAKEETVVYMPSMESAMEFLKTISFSQVFVIGGAQLYNQCFPWVHRVFFTLVSTHVECDAFIAMDWISQFKLTSKEAMSISKETISTIEFQVYERI